MMFHRLGLINKNQLGFTLIELALAIAISGVITGGITMTIFSVVNGNIRTSNHMTVVRQVQNAGYWVSHDALMAQAEPVIMTNGSGQLVSITLTWAEWGSGGAHQVTYTLEGTELWRDYDGQRSLVAQYIDSDPDNTNCDFTGGKLTFTVTATVQEQSETRIYEAGPRPGS